MKRQQKFAIAGVAGAMLMGAGTGVVLNLPTSAGASGVSIATPVTDPATSDTTGTAGTAGTSDSGTTTEAAPDHAGPGEFLKTQLDALVAAGTITQAQEDAIIAGIEANRPALGDHAGDHGGPGRGPMGGGHGGRGFGGGLDAAATALGVTTDALKTDLEAGKTIADVATEKGVDVQTVIDAIVAEQTADITQRVTDMVNGVRPAPPAEAPDTDDTTPTTTG
jgi:hypothetical protein